MAGGAALTWQVSLYANESQPRSLHITTCVGPDPFSPAGGFTPLMWLLDCPSRLTTPGGTGASICTCAPSTSCGGTGGQITKRTTAGHWCVSAATSTRAALGSCSGCASCELDCGPTAVAAVLRRKPSTRVASASLVENSIFIACTAHCSLRRYYVVMTTYTYPDFPAKTYYLLAEDAAPPAPSEPFLGGLAAGGWQRQPVCCAALCAALSC